MNIVLLDTNIVSFALKGDTRAAAYAPYLADNRLAISFVTVAELFEWAATRKWGARRIASLEQTLATYLVIPVDIDLCRIWGTLRAEQYAVGKAIAPQDCWIAATALRHKLPLITHNPTDFAHVAGIEIRTVVSF